MNKEIVLAGEDTNKQCEVTNLDNARFYLHIAKSLYDKVSDILGVAPYETQFYDEINMLTEEAAYHLGLDLDCSDEWVSHPFFDYLDGISSFEELVDNVEEIKQIGKADNVILFSKI